MTKRRAAFGLSALLLAGIVASLPVPAKAAQTNFSLRIVPLNCVFTVVDVDTQTLFFHTPAECGEQPAPVPPPIPLERDPPEVPNENSNSGGGRTEPVIIRVTTPTDPNYQAPAAQVPPAAPPKQERVITFVSKTVANISVGILNNTALILAWSSVGTLALTLSFAIAFGPLGFPQAWSFVWADPAGKARILRGGSAPRRRKKL